MSDPYPPDVLLCNVPYERSKRYQDHGILRPYAVLLCQLKAGHEGVHTWSGVYAMDTGALMSLGPPTEVTTTSTVEDFIDGIAVGEYDPYLELILAAGHDRKLALRGVRGFPRTR